MRSPCGPSSAQYPEQRRRPAAHAHQHKVTPGHTGGALWDGVGQLRRRRRLARFSGLASLPGPASGLEVAPAAWLQPSLVIATPRARSLTVCVKVVVRSGGETYIYCSVLHITGGDVGWQSDYSLVVSALLLSLVGWGFESGWWWFELFEN